MGKQRTQQRIRAGEDTIGAASLEQAPIMIFTERYRLNLEYMGPEHAAANAHDAVQRHLASVKEAQGGDPV